MAVDWMLGWLTDQASGIGTRREVGGLSTHGYGPSALQRGGDIFYPND
jgi:hypothetical protein